MQPHIEARIYFSLASAGFCSLFTGAVQGSVCIFPWSYKVEPTGFCAIPSSLFALGFIILLVSATAFLLVRSGILNNPDRNPRK